MFKNSWKHDLVLPHFFCLPNNEITVFRENFWYMVASLPSMSVLLIIAIPSLWLAIVPWIFNYLLTTKFFYNSGLGLFKYSYTIAILHFATVAATVFWSLIASIEIPNQKENSDKHYRTKGSYQHTLFIKGKLKMENPTIMMGFFIFWTRCFYKQLNS